MKKPKHQVWFTYISWLLIGFLGLGAFLGAVADAVSLITTLTAFIGTITIVVLLIFIQNFTPNYKLNLD